MKYSEILPTFYNFISSATDLTVIYADQNAPRPSTSYITLKMTTLTEIGQIDNICPDEITGIRDNIYRNDINISLQGYGIISLDALQNIKEYFEKELTKQEIESYDISILRNGNIINISTLIDNEIEPRFSYEILLNSVFYFEENVGIIENIEFSGTYDPVS